MKRLVEIRGVQTQSTQSSGGAQTQSTHSSRLCRKHFPWWKHPLGSGPLDDWAGAPLEGNQLCSRKDPVLRNVQVAG